MSIHVPLADAAETLQAFAAGAGLSLGAALRRFRGPRRGNRDSMACRPARSATTPLSAGRWTIIPAWCSRSRRARAREPLAGGGRYDRLLTLLGASKPIAGVGFSVWLDRIEALREGEA